MNNRDRICERKSSAIKRFIFCTRMRVRNTEIFFNKGRNRPSEQKRARGLNLFSGRRLSCLHFRRKQLLLHLSHQFPVLVSGS